MKPTMTVLRSVFLSMTLLFAILVHDLAYCEEEAVGEKSVLSGIRPKGFEFEWSSEESKSYFDTLADRDDQDDQAPPWVHILSPQQPTIMMDSSVPIEYHNPSGQKQSNAYIILQAAPGYLFKQLDIRAQVDIREVPKVKGSYFIYLSPYNPFGGLREAHLVYEKFGPQKLEATLGFVPGETGEEAHEESSFKQPWPIARARLFSSTETKRIYKWSITAQFVEGNAADTIQSFLSEQAAKVEGRVHIYGTPSRTKMGIDREPYLYESFATSLKPGKHTAFFSHSEWGERSVDFSIAPLTDSTVGISFENGWCNYTLLTLPSDLEHPALASLPGSRYLIVGSRKTNQVECLYGWVADGLFDWELLGKLPINSFGENNCLPSLCRLNDGTVLLLWFYGEGTTARLMSSSTTDGKEWQTPRPLPPFKHSPDIGTPASVISARQGDLIVVVGEQWLRGSPSAWGEWELIKFTERVSEDIKSPDIVDNGTGNLLMAFHGKAYYPKTPYSWPSTSVFVTSSATGETWSTPIEIGHGTDPHLFCYGQNRWIVFRGRNYLEAHYSRDGNTWIGPSRLTPLFDEFEQGDIASLSDGRFAAVDFLEPSRRAKSHPIMHVGRYFPDHIQELEDFYRWEDFDKASNAISLQNAGKQVWSINPYTGFGYLEKDTGDFVRSQTMQQRGLRPTLSQNTIGALSVEGDHVWIGANGAGVFCLDRKTNEFVFEAEAGKSLRFDIITALAVDANFVWAGTPIGLEACNRTDEFWVDFDYVEELKGLPISALNSNGNRLWIGTHDGRMLRFDGIDEVLSPIQWDEPDRPKTIGKLLADNNNVWIATDTGLWEFNETSGDLRRLHTIPVDDVAIDTQYLWMAAGNRLWRIARASGKCEEILVNSDIYKRPSSYSIWSVSVDEQFVYASIYGGITRGDKFKVQTK